MPITLSRQQLSDLYRQSRGFGENALSMLTGGIGEPVAGFASLAALARGEDAAGARDAVRDAFTYQPRTAEGQGQQRMLGELAQSAMNSAPVRTWQRGVDYAGRASPVAGATLQTVPTALGALTGYKSAMQTGNALSQRLAQAQRAAMENAMIPRVLSRQAGMIDIWGELLDADNKGGRSFAKTKAQEMIKNNPELADDVIRNYNDLGYSDIKTTSHAGDLYAEKQHTTAYKKEQINDSDFDAIKKMISSHYDDSARHQVYGYRIIPDDLDLSVGDYLPESFRWDNGVNTGEGLGGTSSLGIDIDDIDDGIRQAQRLRKKYLGKKHAIIATEKRKITGDDEGEYVLPDARIVGFIRE